MSPSHKTQPPGQSERPMRSRERLQFGARGGGRPIHIGGRHIITLSPRQGGATLWSRELDAKALAITCSTETVLALIAELRS